ncbi:MAG: hypothetical protein IPQ18_10745 [Saprospiraceae bacterium]|nr:hypothetical protein [Saprospiraceae bacterium]
MKVKTGKILFTNEAFCNLFHIPVSPEHLIGLIVAILPMIACIYLLNPRFL